MKIGKAALAGSLESSDALVQVWPQATRRVDIESVVLAQYGGEIRRVVDETLDELGVQGGRVHVNDRGAINCVLKARVETALRRAAAEEEG